MKPTQQTLHIKRIEDGIAQLIDGSLRSALIVSSTNFALKSAPEQEALLASYAGFLNTLDFPIQIVIQSRILNLNSYIKKLQDAANNQDNPLLKQQTISYASFIDELIAGRNIMTKNFYVIVPFNKDEFPGAKKLFGGNLLAKAKEMLLDRTAVVSQGLGGIGLLNAQLDTQEVVELFYRTLNGEVAHREKIYSLNDFSAPAVTTKEPLVKAEPKK
jgi:hypothetical protein